MVGPIDRFVRLDPEVDRILSPFTNPNPQLQPDNNMPLSELAALQTDTESADARVAGDSSSNIQTVTQDTPSPAQDMTAPGSSKRKATTWLDELKKNKKAKTNIQEKPKKNTKAKPKKTSTTKAPPEPKPVPANQPTITSVLRSATRREAVPIPSRVINDPEDELNGCFVFEEDEEGISALLDDIDNDPMYLPEEDSEGLITVVEDDILDQETDQEGISALLEDISKDPMDVPNGNSAEDERLDSEVISALLDDWENDNEPTNNTGTSPSIPADPSNGPTRVQSEAPEVTAEGSADSAPESTSILGTSGINFNDPLYVNHNWPLPDFLKEYHHRPNNKYPIKPVFTPTNMYRIESKYVLGIYKHRQDGPEAQHRAVMSVLYHECDHPQTSLEQREWYHRYCDDGCGYKQWVSDGKSGDSYKKTHYKDAQDNLHEWKHGIFAGIDTAYPSAFVQMVVIFDNLGRRELMERCRSLRTQNANESIHSKLFYILLKIKDHGSPRFKFGCQQVALDHNFGPLKASLLNCLGTMTPQAHIGYINKIKQGTRSAKRVYENSKGGNSINRGSSHRKKIPVARSRRGRATVAMASAGTPSTSNQQRPQQSGRFVESGHYSTGGGD